MGVVYEALNTWTDRPVALKLLHPWFSSEAETVQRFVREAKSATRIRHRNIVDVLDLGQDPKDGSLFMVQELVSGETLRMWLAARRSLTLDECVPLVVPIMRALAACH